MKISRELWLSEGLRFLGEQGPEALKIDRLCRHLEVSKGSFYHHFSDRSAYVEALLEHWLTSSTEAVFESLASVPDPAQRGKQLNAHIARANLKPEIELRAWGRHNARVADAVARVDRRRMEYLANLISLRTGEREQAGSIANMIYSQFVGCQYLQHSINQESWARMDQLLQTMVQQYLDEMG
ncbi:TetR/AcrR family transcriptional regulator [Halomonas sp. ANAO-440]|uniref:TetR/AcrR family transcriptional regulator n=1 Tax=Halomonas sp. ANAO-440 TaxID=2861360 RepID=UPI001CAA546D|nr:TetR/AcrR family transcriptional regulator [Halomonas sp. ANAO-440]MBZ0331404.1 TetR/AcrR family transcriptional regulator [Halomonas sp. ANAO-440]